MFILAPPGVYYGARAALTEFRLICDTLAIDTWWTCLQHASMFVFYLSIPWAYVIAWWKAVNVLWYEPPKPKYNPPVFSRDKDGVLRLVKKASMD